MAKRVIEAQARLTAKDDASGVFEALGRKIDRLVSSTRKLNTEASNIGRIKGIERRADAIAVRAREAERASRLGEKAALAAGAASRLAGPVIGAAALTSATRRFAELDRRVTRIGITADASAPEVKGLAERLYQLGQSVALPTADITTGLETLVAQGRNLKDSLEFLPSVAKTAAATGASVEDIAKSADAVANNFKIAAPQMQLAFDTMAAGGKAGTFELREMSRYLPSLGPAAAAAGFKGVQGLRDLVATLQIIRKGTGTSEEAAGSMSNILQKLESDETQKRFKKLGIDLSAGMAKARKEGKNLVDVLEDMTAQAIKGDLSKIPQLFNDMEFARGMRAIMAARGERQKLAETIARTAEGSVEIDLTRVQNDMQAKLDRLAEMVKHRSRQVGEIAANIALPLDDKLKEISEGKNPVVNAINERAKLVVPDAIAREELRTGWKGNYDAETRRYIDARKEMVQRQQIEAERARLEGRVTGLAGERAAIVADAERQKGGSQVKAIRDTVDGRTRAKTDPLDREAQRAQAALAGLNALVSRMDELQLRLAETGKPLGDSKGLRIPNAAIGGNRFDRTVPGSLAFGPQGARVQPEPSWMPPAYVPPIPHLPPIPRPESLPKAPVTSEDLSRLFPPGGLKVDIGDSISALKATVEQPIPVDVTGKVAMDPSSKAQVNVTVRVEGPGQVVGMSSSSSGNIAVSEGTAMRGTFGGPPRLPNDRR